MATLKIGSKGRDVAALQANLAALGYRPGAADGAYGANTAAAVKRFQTDQGLTPDGIYGPNSVAAMAAAVAEPSVVVEPSTAAENDDLSSKPLVQRCVALTGSFETSAPPPGCFSGLTGNFDGQGISFGALQQNFGQGSLQPLLKKMIADHQSVIAAIFGDDFAELQNMLAMTDKTQQVAWSVGKQQNGATVDQPWRGYFVKLGETPEYQAIQGDAAENVYQKGLKYCRQFGLKSERAAALMFDIVTQNGSINAAVAEQIADDFAKLSPNEPDGTPNDETPKLVIVANRRAEASNPQWVENVRARKLVIANGQGKANGMTYNLAQTYAVTLDPAADLA